MTSSEAINLRITELLKERNMSVYKLSVFRIQLLVILDVAKLKEPSISSLIHICEGFDISLKVFFDSPYFNDVEAVDRVDRIEKESNKAI